MDYLDIARQIAKEGKGPAVERDRETRRRADLFKTHLYQPGPTGFFTLTVREIPEGYCLTCGECLASGKFGLRCEVCIDAAGLALKEITSEAEK